MSHSILVWPPRLDVGGSRMDCALKNVEVAESQGYQATEASALFRFLPLAAPLLGG